MVPTYDKSVALDELRELTKVPDALSVVMTDVDLASNLEELLAQCVLEQLEQDPAGVQLTRLIDTTSVFFGHASHLGLASNERGILLKVLNRLRKAGLIAAASSYPYRITVDGWLKIQEAKRAAAARDGKAETT